MSDEQYLDDPDERDGVVATDREPTSVDEVRAGDDPYYAPQNEGDVGYEPPAIIPELDGEGGTKFVVGDQEFASMQEAIDATQPAPEQPVVTDEE